MKKAVFAALLCGLILAPSIGFSQTPVTILPPPAGSGCFNKVIEPVASDNHQTINNGATTVCWVIVFNNSATVNYVRIYDAGTGFNGCNSATGITFEAQIPANTSVGGFIIPFPPQGLILNTGLSVCISGGYGQTDTTAATASAISANFGYNKMISQ